MNTTRLMIACVTVVIATAGRLDAAPYVGTATETDFCITQPQFCDVDELNPEGSEQ